MIGDIIRKFREQRGWTQEELATKMGYTSKSTINKIENNINDVGQRKIEKFAQVFNCDPTDLVAGNTAMAVSEHGTAYTPTLPDYDLERVEKAMDLLSRFESLSPDEQRMFLAFLDKFQSH